jgi:hypothetical protein
MHEREHIVLGRVHQLRRLIERRSQTVGEWGKMFGDAVIATAILDRLLHHSHVIAVRWGELSPARKASGRPSAEGRPDATDTIRRNVTGAVFMSPRVHFGLSLDSGR